MKLCKDCAHYRLEREFSDTDFAKCMHGAEVVVTISPIDGKVSRTVMDTFCSTKRQDHYDSDEQRESIQRCIDDGTTTLPKRYWPCGPEARYFVERPVIVSIPKQQTRWERFIDWLRSWL